MADGVRVRLLGPVGLITSAGVEMAFRGHAARLLAWLALRPGRVWTAADLADRLWPEGPPPTFRTVIQGHVSRLRRALDATAGDRIDTVPGGYVLRVERAAVDAHRFARLRAEADEARLAGRVSLAAERLAAALDLWSGEALAGLHDDPGLRSEAEALDDQRRDAEERWAEALIESGDHDRALGALGPLVNAEPLRERRWALLMIALTRSGRQADALRAYRRAAATLADRAGLDPGPELRRLETAILVQDPGLDPGRWQPAPGSAPAPLVGLVGRDAERAAVSDRLRSARLVTITGPGGIGKTALAVDVGAAEGASFADGAVVIDLGTGGSDDVALAVATAVGAAAVPPAGGEPAPGDPLARAVAALSGRHVLVVLDNCEHVAGAAAEAAVALLRAGPGVRVLATSQVPLGVAGEAVVALGPLGLPGAGAAAAVVRDSPAGELLGRRLEELGCPVTGDADWGHAGAIVRALDGLPLAIEVAAAAARVEPLASLAPRLAGDGTALLDVEPPVGAGRRRLGTALDDAVARLTGDADDDAVRLYAHLSVFPAGFDAAAAAAVAGLGDDAARAALSRLADASLVTLEAPHRRRARLLQPVRAHAAARLAPGDADAAVTRLAEWCLSLADGLDRSVHGPAQADVIERFMAELPNFRLVLRRLIDSGDIERAALLFERLAPCWVDSPANTEAPVWGEELLSHAGRLSPGPRARLEIAVVHTQFAFELIAARLPLVEQALSRAEAAGDVRAAALAKVQLAIGLGWRGIDLDRAGLLLDEARATLIRLGERYWAAVTREFRGLLALRRLDVWTAIGILEDAVAEHRSAGAPGDVAHALMFIGYARRVVGDETGALRAFDEARLLLDGVRVATWLRATVGAGHAALALGDTEAAGEAFRRAHVRAVEVGDRRIAGTSLVGLATIARRTGADERCIALLVAATGEALDGGDPTDAVTAAGVLAEMLVADRAFEEAAVVLGAASAVDDEVGVRIDFGLAYDSGPVTAAVAKCLGERRMADLAGDGRTIGPAAAVRRAADRLLDRTGSGRRSELRLIEGEVAVHLAGPGPPAAGAAAGGGDE
ncbi:MAG TPA: BTAD domain-containing putative transcriptional regulator [Acidimicrobiales bacterium]|nr:BTAD domain-containing putative transcriptional regulator [Acidimicrobiales bacterium]